MTFRSARSPASSRPHDRDRGGAKSKPWTKPPRGDADADGPIRLYGIHAVEAALRNPQRNIIAAHLTENAERRLGSSLAAKSLPITRVTPRDLDRLLGADTVHQGAAIEVEPLPDVDLSDLVAAARAGAPIVVLDQVTDPHNVGAILRSIAVFGGAGLVMTRRHSAPLNGVLAKSASGALELVPIALVANLARAVDELKELGVTVVGLDGAAVSRLEAHPWHKNPTALVLGAEGKGLRQLTRASCHHLASLTTGGVIASLNVSNAAAVALHEAAVARLGTRSSQ